ncbi:MAG: hypothetical protein WBE72_10120 [Terracidiphilus sp.]
MAKEEEGLSNEELRQIRKDMERAVDAHDPKKFRRLLLQLEVDPDGEVGKKRMAAFYRACNMDLP